MPVTFLSTWMMLFVLNAAAQTRAESSLQQVRPPASSVPVKEKNSLLIKDEWKVSASLYRQ